MLAVLFVNSRQRHLIITNMSARKMVSEGNEDSMESNKDMEESSEDEGSDDSEHEKQLEASASELEKKIEENPYNYNAYVELIKILHKMGELERLRKARRKMSENFPLTAELWLAWVKDEIKLCASDAERQAVKELFEKAVMDYLSVDVWLEYAQFSIGNMGLKDGVEEVRNIFERALTAGGLHVAKGTILWEAYREFENVMLAMIRAKTGSTDLTEEQQKSYDDQKNRLVTLFRRQLACPLLDMEKTYTEFTEWINEEPRKIPPDEIKNAENGFKKALLKLSKILPYEEKLLSSNEASRLQCYREYLAYEISQDEPARVVCLYERAIADHCLDPSLWLEYIDYVDKTLKIDTVILPILKRAVRNCPWTSAIWQHYLRALERYNRPHEEVHAIMQEALSVGFSAAEDYCSLWLTYIDYMRRRVDWNAEDHSEALKELRATFNKACEHLAQNYGLKGDPSCEILQYWARIEALYCKDMETFRKLWSDIMSQGHDKSAAMWLEYSRWERSHGDSKHLRRLFARALSVTEDWPESIGNAWLSYERDEGTLESYETALSKFNSRMKDVNEKRAKEAAKELKSSKSEDSRRWGSKKRKAEWPPEPGSAQKKKPDTEGKWAHVAPRTVIKQRAKTSTEMAKEEEKGDESTEKIRSAPPPGYKGDGSPEEKNKGEPEFVPHIADPSKDEYTVFVSNLDYSVGEEKLRELFSTVGEIADLRLVKDYKRRSKGYGYVEFKTIAEAQKALQMDRTSVDGRPMFVSRCDSSKTTRKPVFKYSSNLEKHKLFVKGLPVSLKTEELEEIFKQYGELKEVRLVTYRNGHSKGLAYVEYKDEASAAQALLKTDGMIIGDKRISVAISKPPERKQPANADVPQIPSLGGGPKESGPRGRSRTQVSLVPRSVQVAAISSDSKSAASSKDATGASGSNNHESTSASAANGDSKEPGDKKSLSNADFRQMLLGRK